MQIIKKWITLRFFSFFLILKGLTKCKNCNRKADFEIELKDWQNQCENKIKQEIGTRKSKAKHDSYDNLASPSVMESQMNRTHFIRQTAMKSKVFPRRDSQLLLSLVSAHVITPICWYMLHDSSIFMSVAIKSMKQISKCTFDKAKKTKKNVDVAYICVALVYIRCEQIELRIVGKCWCLVCCASS